MGVLPAVVRRWVWSRNLVNDEALAHWGLFCQIKQNSVISIYFETSRLFINTFLTPARPRPTTLLPPRSNGKPEEATAVYKLLMMGKRMPETCWAVFERRGTNLRDWCIWLDNLFECMMMHGLTNPKFGNVYIRNTNRKSSRATLNYGICSPV
jgi:hypothetical protein